MDRVVSLVKNVPHGHFLCNNCYMNIGIYSPYLDTLTGGEKYILTAASSLSKEHRVTIFWDDSSILEKAAKKFNLEFNNVVVSSNIFSADTGFIKRYIQTLKYDRILFLSDGSIPLVGAKKLLIHFQFPVEWVNTNSFLFLFKKSRVSKIICNSYFTKQFIDKKFGVNSFLLYPPATTATEVKKKKENIILTVGRFSLLKNGTDFKKLGIMVKNFKKFQKKRLKGWTMAIVTSVRPDLENAFKTFEESIKSSHIKIYKNASFQLTEEMYSKAKIYWHAAGFGEDLIRHPERAEHFGISTVEAMSHGCIPVVINAGGQKEIVNDGDNGFLWNTEDELVEKTHAIAVNKDDLKRIAERAVESSERFSNERFCEELNHLIW